MSAAETAAPAPWPSPPQSAPAPESAPHTADDCSSEGPLRSLAQKAYTTNIVRRARQGVPSFAEPAVSRTANTADVVLTHVDGSLTAAHKTLTTDEGKALRSAAVQFWNALYVFVAMLAMAALRQAEGLLSIHYDDQPDGQLPKPQTRVVEVFKVAGGKIKTRFERREREVQGTGEAEIYKKAKFVGGISLAVLTCVITALTKYSGPAKEYIVPAAERAVSVLPDDPSHESQGNEAVDDTTSDGAVSGPDPDAPSSPLVEDSTS